MVLVSLNPKKAKAPPSQQAGEVASEIAVYLTFETSGCRDRFWSLNGALTGPPQVFHPTQTLWELTMKQDRVDQHDSVQVQSQDPIGIIANQSALATDARLPRDVAPESSFGIAWALAH
jgi:hypothetical protein